MSFFFQPKAGTSHFCPQTLMSSEIWLIFCAFQSPKLEIMQTLQDENPITCVWAQMHTCTVQSSSRFFFSLFYCMQNSLANFFYELGPSVLQPVLFALTAKLYYGHRFFFLWSWNMGPRRKSIHRTTASKLGSCFSEILLTKVHQLSVLIRCHPSP